MRVDELQHMADEVFWMDRELPEMVFRRTDLSFFVTEGLCPMMEPVSTLIGDVVRALESPGRHEVCWVNREGGADRLQTGSPSVAGSFGRDALAANHSIYPAWRTVLDNVHHGLMLKFVMFSPLKKWGLWVDVQFEMAVLGLPPNLNARLRERVEREFSADMAGFVDGLMRPLGSSNSQWQTALDAFVGRYQPAAIGRSRADSD